MKTKRFSKNIVSIEGTIGKVFSDNRDALLESKTIEDLRENVNRLFDENHIDTPKSRQIKLKLAKMGLASGLMYVQNVMFAAMGMGTF